MAPVQPDALLLHVRRQVEAHGTDALSDRVLIQRFAAAGDEAAFATLVRRHGRMVLRVCRQVLRNAADAEDAFQATFLALARQAAAPAWQDSLAGWLHKVASRVALKVRRAAGRRRAHEARADVPPSTAVVGIDINLGEAQTVLAEELNRLPDKLRLPLVLCYLEGMTQDQAARQTGWSLSTLKRRLRRGLALLQGHLQRRGLVPAVVLSVSRPGVAEAVPAALEDVATRASVLFRAGGKAAATRASALAEGALKTMFWARLRFVSALLLTAALAVASGLSALRVFTDSSQPPVPPPHPLPLSPRGRGVRDEGPAERARVAEPVKLATLRGHGPTIAALALSPDGKTLASAGDSLVKLWDVDRKGSKLRTTLRQAADPRRPSLVQPAPTHEGMLFAVAFSPDGKTLASGAGFVRSRTPTGEWKTEGEVRLWDMEGKEKAAVRRRPVFIYSLAFSPDGRTLAWGGGVDPATIDTTYHQDFKDLPPFKEIGEVAVWDIATGRARTFFRGATGRIKTVAFSPDGKTLATGGRDGVIRLFDVAGGRERARLREEGGREVYALAFSPDGKTLASVPGDRMGHPEYQGESVKLWDLATGRVRARLEAPGVRVFAVAFSADGRTVTTAGTVLPIGQDKGEVRLWDAATGRPRGTPLRVDHNSCAVAVGARGKMKVLAAAGCHGSGINLASEITLWELDPPGSTAP
jgi:RNA polymerase sigma factor (sigma-70 family)